MAKLNVFVSAIDDPCGLDNRTWYVTIYDCDGNVLEWCGKRYVVLRAKCGHLHVEVPPGCYYVKAVWGFTVVTPGLVYRVNHFTEGAIVTACCEETTCVKLFNPSAHRCGYIYVRALRDLVAQKAVQPELAKPVDEGIVAINRALEKLDGTPPPFEMDPDHEKEIERLVTQQEKKERRGKRGKRTKKKRG